MSLDSDGSPGRGMNRRLVLSLSDSVCLSARLVRTEKDASRRLLQPSSDTSTREPASSQARFLRREDRGAPLLSRGNPRGVRPSSDDPTPGGDAFDGAPPASAASTRAPEGRAPPKGGGYLAAAFSTAHQAGDRPLTLCRAPRSSVSGFARSTRIAFAAPSSKRAVPTIPSAFHRQVLHARCSRSVAV